MELLLVLSAGSGTHFRSQGEVYRVVLRTCSNRPKSVPKLAWHQSQTKRIVQSFLSLIALRTVDSSCSDSLVGLSKSSRHQPHRFCFKEGERKCCLNGCKLDRPDMVHLESTVRVRGEGGREKAEQCKREA